MVYGSSCQAAANFRLPSPTAFASQFVNARPQRGRGALSAKREEVPLGVQFRSTWPDNRKVSGEYGTVTRRGVEDAATYKVCAVGDGLHEPQVPSRDCHVALLLAMTHQAGAAAHQCPSAVELPCTRRSLSAAAFFSRTADLYGSPQPTENIQNLAIRARTVHFYATRICDSSQLVKHYFFEKGIDSFLICVILFL